MYIWFCLAPGTELLKPVSWIIRVRGAFSFSFFVIHSWPLSTIPEFTLRMTFAEPQDIFRMKGWLKGEPTMWLEGWNFQPNTPTPTSSSTVPQRVRRSISHQWWWFNQPCLCNGTFEKPLNSRDQRASRLVTASACQEGHAPQTPFWYRNSCAQDPSRPALCTSSLLIRVYPL